MRAKIRPSGLVGQVAVGHDQMNRVWRLVGNELFMGSAKAVSNSLPLARQIAVAEEPLAIMPTVWKQVGNVVRDRIEVRQQVRDQIRVACRRGQ